MSRPLIVEVKCSLHKQGMGCWAVAPRNIRSMVGRRCEATSLAPPALRASPGIDRHLRHQMTMRFPEKGMFDLPSSLTAGMDFSALHVGRASF